jgi:hypothetical protein
MALWTVGTVLWLVVPGSTYHQLLTLAKSPLQRLDWRMGQRPTSSQSPAAPATKADESTRPPSSDGAVASQHSNSVPIATLDRSAAAPSAALRPVYRTTAQQLYRDYSANVVAIQTKIGASRVRVTGNIAEIDQDPAGHPIVRLFTDKDSKPAAMSLTEDQRTAAAQLVKNQAVEIECDKVGHSADLLQGRDCTLATVDVRPKQVNLALFLANDRGATNVYVVGPMPETACLTRADSISSQLHVNQRGEYVVWRGCTDAARENIPPGGCRLHSSPVSIADIPPAHLWRYDCSASSLARTNKAKKTTTRAPVTGTLAVAVPPNTGSADAATGSSSGLDEKAALTFAAPAVATAAVEAATPAAATSTAGTPGVVSAPPVATAAPINASAPPAVGPADHGTANNLRLASASDSDTGAPTTVTRAPAEEVTVAHASQAGNPAPDAVSSQAGSHEISSPAPSIISDDLSQVRAVDPQAADHIATYCAKSVQQFFMADCRRREAEAWTRLVVQKEFPTLDDATRKKCSEPPFPDTYVAKESCARYQLHIN